MRRGRVEDGWMVWKNKETRRMEEVKMEEKNGQRGDIKKGEYREKRGGRRGQEEDGEMSKKEKVEKMEDG